MRFDDTYSLMEFRRGEWRLRFDMTLHTWTIGLAYWNFGYPMQTLHFLCFGITLYNRSRMIARTKV